MYTDALAVSGARLHQVAPDMVEGARKRKEMAINIQRMMVSILQARAVAEGSNQHDVADVDRHSENSDCMDLGGS